ncbi:MAG: hypothetical protein CMJ83_17510 [Planctomycetes bacterium]|nr:hypothetical protein [Planctomycetota bacterium]
MSVTRKTRVWLLGSLLTLVGFAPAQTSIIWNAPVPVSGPNDVSTVGVGAIAVNCGLGSSQATFNGVTFLPDPTPGNFIIQPPITANGYTLDLPYNRASSSNFWTSPAPSGSTTMGQALDTARYLGPGSNTAPVTCTISGLTVGNFYEIQIWSADDRGGPGWRVSNWADTCGVAGPSLSIHSVTGIFSATSASRTFCNGPQTGGAQPGAAYNLLNMIQVRDLSATPEYQTNAFPGASLDINGVQGTNQTAATVTIPTGVPATLNLGSTNAGQLWDLGSGLAPLIPASAGALTTSDGQIVNLDIADPTLGFWFNLLQGPTWGPTTSVSAPFSLSFATGVSLQMIVVDPSLLSGVALSQPVRLIVQ